MLKLFREIKTWIKRMLEEVFFKLLLFWVYKDQKCFFAVSSWTLRDFIFVTLRNHSVTYTIFSADLIYSLLLNKMNINSQELINKIENLPCRLHLCWKNKLIRQHSSEQDFRQALHECLYDWSHKYLNELM